MCQWPSRTTPLNVLIGFVLFIKSSGSAETCQSLIRTVALEDRGQRPPGSIFLYFFYVVNKQHAGKWNMRCSLENTCTDGQLAAHGPYVTSIWPIKDPPPPTPNCFNLNETLRVLKLPILDPEQSSQVFLLRFKGSRSGFTEAAAGSVCALTPTCRQSCCCTT